MNVPPAFAVVEFEKHSGVPKYTQATFSNYQKTQVFKALLKALEKVSLEETCHWAIELHCSGQMESLIQQFTYFISERINISNPYLPEWWITRLRKYSQIKTLFPKSAQLINSRNNQEMRNLLAEMSVVLALSEKNNWLIPSKIPKIQERQFRRGGFQSKIINKNTGHVLKFYLGDEIQYGVRGSGTTKLDEHLVFGFQQYVNCIYAGKFDDCAWWLAWIFAYDKSTKNQKLDTPVKAQKNAILPELSDKLEWVWIYWDFLLRYVKQFYGGKENQKMIMHQVKSLYHMYLYGLTKANKHKKIVHLLHAVSYIKKIVDWRTPLISKNKYSYVVQIGANVNVLYQRINSNREGYVNQEMAENIYHEMIVADQPELLQNQNPAVPLQEYGHEYENGINTKISKNQKVPKTPSKKQIEDEEKEQKRSEIGERFSLIDSLLSTPVSNPHSNIITNEIDMSQSVNPYLAIPSQRGGYSNEQMGYTSGKEVPNVTVCRDIVKSISIKTSTGEQCVQDTQDTQDVQNRMVNTKKLSQKSKTSEKEQRQLQFMRERQQELERDEIENYNNENQDIHNERYSEFENGDYPPNNSEIDILNNDNEYPEYLDY